MNWIEAVSCLFFKIDMAWFFFIHEVEIFKFIQSNHKKKNKKIKKKFII